MEGNSGRDKYMKSTSVRKCKMFSLDKWCDEAVGSGINVLFLPVENNKASSLLLQPQVTGTDQWGGNMLHGLGQGLMTWRYHIFHRHPEIAYCKMFPSTSSTFNAPSGQNFTHLQFFHCFSWLSGGHIFKGQWQLKPWWDLIFQRKYSRFFVKQPEMYPVPSRLLGFSLTCPSLLPFPLFSLHLSSLPSLLPPFPRVPVL